MSGALFVDLHDERPEPDWNELAELGAVGAYLKAGEGTSRIGGRLAGARARRARAAGLFVGFYWFARPDLGHTAAAEAHAFVGALGALSRQSDWRPVLDLERGAPGSRDPATAGAWGARVLSALARAGRRRSAWYASSSPARRMSPLYGWPAWLADYGPNDGRDHGLPALAGISVLAHQYSSVGRLGHYSGDVSAFTTGRVARMLAFR